MLMNLLSSESPSKEMLEELCQLFTELTARLRAPASSSSSLVTVGGQPITTSNESDDDLACWFSPLLGDLNATVAAKEQRLGKNFTYFDSLVTFKQQVGQLNAIFATFKTMVDGVCRQVKVSIFS